MDYVVAVSALIVALLLFVRSRRMARRVETNAQRIYKMTAEIRNLRNEVRDDLRRIERLAGQGALGPDGRTPALHQDMLIADALAVEPNLAKVLAAHRIGSGGCRSCATSESETLAEAAVHYGANIDTVMTALHDYLNDPHAWEDRMKGREAESDTIENEPALLQIKGLGD